MKLRQQAVLGLAVFALAACNPGGSREAADASGLTRWASVQAEAINAPEGVAYTQATVDGVTVAQISGVPDDATPAGLTGGVSIRMPGAVEAQASGARIQVTVRAFAAEDGALMGVAYSTNEAGNSGWQRFMLSTQPRDYAFAYDVAPMQGGGGDFLGFRSYGDGTVQVVGYRVDVLPRPDAAPAPSAAVATP